MHPLRNVCFFLLAISLQFGVVSVYGQEKPDQPTKKDKPATIKVIKGDPIENVPENMRPNKERYKIGFEDVLQVTVYRHPELSQTVTVARDGTILLPRINEPINAVCKTERELASLITALYRNYLRNPFVNVRALEQKSQPFAVLGAVNKPGSFYMNRRVRLLELIAFAEGPDKESYGTTVQVARIGNLSDCKIESDAPTEVQFFSYNLEAVLKGEQNPFLVPGDIVTVKVADEAYVVGNVEDPTTIKLREPITLTQAIAKAGGIGNTAKTSKVVIQRSEKGGEQKSLLVYDLKQIRLQKVPDPYLQANDIVEVPTSKSKVLTKEIIKVLTAGLSNLFYRFPL